MLERVAFEYAVIRVIPRVERGECINAGVMVICRARRFLQAKVALDRARLHSFAPYLSTDDIDAIDRQVAQIPLICAGDQHAGPIAELAQRERWHWLAAPSSTIVQPGAVHSGMCVDPAATLDHLLQLLVEVDSIS